MLYSATEKSFYLREITPDVPPDVVEITEERHRELLAGQANGQVIVAGAGGLPELADRPATDPAEALAAWRSQARVTRFQARAALMAAGQLEAVEATVAASDDPMIRLAWAESIEFPRLSPTIAALAAAMGMSDDALDDLFRAAQQINA